MSTSRLTRSCSLAAADLLTRTEKPVSQMTTAEVIAYTQRAVSLGAHLALNIAEKATDTRFERSVNEALNRGDGAYRP